MNFEIVRHTSQGYILESYPMKAKSDNDLIRKLMTKYHILKIRNQSLTHKQLIDILFTKGITYLAVK